RDREVAGSNPVAPTILRNEPFGEYVEGLFHCEDASYRSTSVFKWHCTMVELTRRSDGTPLFAGRNVFQIPSPVLAVADRSLEAELLRQCFYGCRHRRSERRDLESLAVKEPRRTNHAVSRSCPALSASGSVFETTLPRAVSRGRRFQPPDRRKSRS